MAANDTKSSSSARSETTHSPWKHRRLHLGRPACHRNIPQRQVKFGAHILGGFSLDCLFLHVQFGPAVYSYRRRGEGTGSMFAIVSAQNSVMGVNEVPENASLPDPIEMLRGRCKTVALITPAPFVNLWAAISTEEQPFGLSSHSSSTGIRTSSTVL
jgi:hypothetical protein